MILENVIKIDIADLVFGQTPAFEYSKKITPYLDVIGEADAEILITSDSSNPFSVRATNTNGYQLVFSIDRSASEIEFNKNYPIKLTCNSNFVMVNVQFLYTEDYRTTDWQFSEPPTIVANAVKFQEFPFNTRYVIAKINAKFRMLMAYLSALKNKISDLSDKYNTKHKLNDVLQSAIYGNLFPIAALVSYNRNQDGEIVSIDIDSNGVLLRVEYEYSDFTTTIDMSQAIPPFTSTVPNISTKKLVTKTSVYRMGSIGSSPSYRYRLCSSVTAYTNIARMTQMNSRITEPFISSITVVE